MPSRKPHGLSRPGRDQLIARIADDLNRDTAPRLQLLAIMLLAGGVAFLVSVLLLWSAFDALERMPLRYTVAALCGYLAFIGLIRIWIGLHRPARVDSSGHGPDLLDVVNPADLLSSGSGVDEPRPLFSGGHSGGGGGASSQWSATGSRHTSGSGGSWGIDLDFDAAVWLVIAGACAAAGVIAVGYVIYMAPVLLAEVALDAAIISLLYRRLRRDEQGYWLTTVLRRTWLPALVLVVFTFLTGFALQIAAPEARSIGGVVQSVSGSR
jgi:uncharacterized membrane protein YgcG